MILFFSLQGVDIVKKLNQNIWLLHLFLKTTPRFVCDVNRSGLVVQAPSASRKEGRIRVWVRFWDRIGLWLEWSSLHWYNGEIWAEIFP